MSFCQITVFLSFCNDITCQMSEISKGHPPTHWLTHQPMSKLPGQLKSSINSKGQNRKISVVNFKVQDLISIGIAMRCPHQYFEKGVVCWQLSGLVRCSTDGSQSTEGGSAATSTTLRTGSRIQYCNSAAARGFQENETFADCNSDAAELRHCLL